jgi:hypothetical protein
VPLFSSPSAFQSCKRHRPKTHFAPDRACCGSCLKRRRDRQSEKRGIAKRQKHALAMGDAVNAHARAAGLVAETHGAAQNLPRILGQTCPDAAALEGASEASGGGTAPGELRALLEQRQQSLKVAHRLCVAHQSAMAMRASAKSRAPAVPARARPSELSRGEKRAPSPARRESGVRLAATDGKGTRGAGKDPLKGDAPLRVTAAALGWRESPAPAGETRPSRPGSPISPRAAAAALASASTRVASSQRSALDQMWAHLDTLWAQRAQQLRQLQALQSMQSLQTPWAMSRPVGVSVGGVPALIAAPGGSLTSPGSGAAGGSKALVSVASPSGARERAAAAAARSPERAASGDTTSDVPTGEPSGSSGESGG